MLSLLCPNRRCGSLAGKSPSEIVVVANDGLLSGCGVMPTSGDDRFATQFFAEEVLNFPQHMGQDVSVILDEALVVFVFVLAAFGHFHDDMELFGHLVADV